MEPRPEKVGSAPEKGSVSAAVDRQRRRGVVAGGGSPSPLLLPKDVGYWKLAPPALGLLGIGVYAGFRKQMKAEAEEAQALARKGLPPLPFSPYRHATGAFMYGTALCFGCTSAGVLAVGYFMGVRNLREFSEKMSVWAPKQMAKLGFRHRPDYIQDRDAVKGMSYDEEWEYIDRLLEKDEPRPSSGQNPQMTSAGDAARGTPRAQD